MLPKDFETPTFCPDCGRQSHYYEMVSALDESFPRFAYNTVATITTWERVEGKHLGGCPNA